MGEDSRWERLFADLEAQLDAAEGAELAAEVDDRTRRERALVELADRLAAWRGQRLVVHTAGGVRLDGVLVDSAGDCLVVRDVGPALVPLAAVTGLVGLGAAAATPGRAGVDRRWSLTFALRSVARDRSPVRLHLTDATTLVGTLDSVGADHVDLAEHPADEARRPRAVRLVRTVPLSALAVLRPAPGTTTLGR